MDDVQPKFLLIDADEQICGSCLDAEGVFVEAPEDDEHVTVEILGCLPSQRMRDYLSGSKRYRQRNPLGLEALRMLDMAGSPLAEFWMGEIIDWRPSPLGRERVDLVAHCGDDVPSSRTRHVWERWRTARPDRINQWAGYVGTDREEWLTIVFHNSRWRTGHPDRPSGRTCDLDGTHVTDKASFYLAIGEAVNGPGGYFGWNLDALSDCLCGHFGAEVPFTLVWHRSHIARESVAFSFEGAGANSTYFDVIRTVFEEKGVDVVLR
ncbi:barstar family protein [Streptosporangium sp. NPDC002544]|uniref:barstar family protein n=1 Tax=Streptosporangium sp. NPDC002544 TaxID=3154538 RepID=UPI00331850D2